MNAITKLVYWLYSKILRITAEKSYFWFGNRVFVHGDYSYNTSITLNLRTSNSDYPMWSYFGQWRYQYNWHGKRTGAVVFSGQHYHYGLLDEVWHSLTPTEKAQTVLDRSQ